VPLVAPVAPVQAQQGQHLDDEVAALRDLPGELLRGVGAHRLTVGSFNRRGASPVMFRIARSISRGTAGVSSSPSSADPLVCRRWSTNAFHHNKNARPE
jgi:hypothetical protein